MTFVALPTASLIPHNGNAIGSLRQRQLIGNDPSQLTSKPTSPTDKFFSLYLYHLS